MAVVPLAELDQIARQLAAERHDAYSERALTRAYEEYLARRRTPIGPFRLRVGEQEYSTVYELAANPAASTSPIELRLDPAPAPGRRGSSSVPSNGSSSKPTGPPRSSRSRPARRRA